QSARNGPRDAETEERRWFPAVLFPAEHLRILPYNRVVADLGDQAPADVLRKLEAVGRLSATTTRIPPRSGSFCIYLGRRWYLHELTESSIDRGDPRRSLDVTLVHERVLGPVLGIADPRTDERIDFVGGRRGPGELEARVDAGQAALAVSLYP